MVEENEMDSCRQLYNLEDLQSSKQGKKMNENEQMHNGWCVLMCNFWVQRMKKREGKSAHKQMYMPMHG